ncbi:MAG: hypothetical protein AUI90_02205 [Deltaproteobacteria bacterium 13_1_40CM_3_69_14]|nr:MAG: hypothetical protein AUI90_02205 [Deltaproteobacteria bacterium 13_1_40CM_3_69_14]
MIYWVFVVPVLFWIISGLRIIQEYESGVIFRLGRFAEVKRAGLNWIVPGVDRMVKVDLRTVTRDVPPQDVITRDNVSLKVSAVIYFRVIEAEKAVRQSESVTASKALELHAIDLIAEDLPELLRKIDGRKIDLGGGEKRTLHTASAEVRNVPWAVKDEVLHGLANPEVAYLIAMLGVIGVMLELFHPGTVVPGVVGGICLVIAAIAFQMLPVNVGALLLILLGIGFFLAEMYVGGHGGFVAAGLVCVVIGSLLLIGPVDKSFYADADFGLGWRIVAPVGAAMAVIAATLAWKLSSSIRQPLRAGGYSLIGEIGEVREDGTVLVAGELWKASSAEPLTPGGRARVLAVHGLTLEVAPEGAALTKATS